MIVSNPENYGGSQRRAVAYTLGGFQKSKTKNKKYDAMLVNKTSGKVIRVPFGDSRYEQYKDSTGLGLYSNRDHKDMKRREAYRKRHQGEQNNKYSSGWFSWYYLW
jgi:hypothetical protein